MASRNHTQKLENMQSEISGIIERGWREVLSYDGLLADKYKMLDSLYDRIGAIHALAIRLDVDCQIKAGIRMICGSCGRMLMRNSWRFEASTKAD